jgi:DNA gyrase subunit B
MKDSSKLYSATSIKVMEGLEAVRKRPSMYIGSTDSEGLHHLVYEIVDNSVDEALAGYCSNIKIILHDDGSCSVEDNGRGIPTDIHPVEKVSAAEVVLTKLHAGGKFDKEVYKFSGGLHGVGVSVVNALSKWLNLTIYQNGKIYKQSFEKGKPLSPLSIVGETDKTGTLIQFLPDDEIFKRTTKFDFNLLSKRLQELAFLNKGLVITIKELSTDKSNEYCYDKGIISFVKHLNRNKQIINDDAIYVSTKDNDLQFEFELAMQYNSGYDDNVVSFVNNINTIDGGTHVSGLKSALTSICNKRAHDLNILKKDEAFSSEDVREGLSCVLSIKVAEPQFEGQTKTKLGNYEIKGIVQSATSSFLDSYFEENPGVARKILGKAENALRAREAAKKARELTRKKNVLESTVLPGKLADCSLCDPEKTEVFIVEGDSAGGSAKTGRDRMSQAILPLRGKILNVEKASIERILANEEIKALISAIGIGVGNENLNIENCRYHKIIIMTDADIDGSHIRTLLLTFFFRYLRTIIDFGYLYIAQPPLYKVKIGKHDNYLQNESELFAMMSLWASEEMDIIIDGKIVEASFQQWILEEAKGMYALFGKIAYELGISSKAVENNIIEKTPVESTLITDEILEGLYSYYNSTNVLKKLEISYKNKIVGQATNNSIVDFCEALKVAIKPFMNIQRYKGLGEMNPDQLWETSMNPDTRQLFRVTVEDAEQANYWFSVLMGEEVSQRKYFIEERAHFVRNLDV